MDPEQFANLLRTGLWAVKRQTGKRIRDIQDEIGYALGRNGGSWIEWLRKGNLPPTLRDSEQIAQLIIDESDLGEEWCRELLISSGHPYPDSAIAALFGDLNSNNPLYDLFLFCHVDDLPAAEELAEHLRQANLHVYLDRWHLQPEAPWQAVIETTLSHCRACVLLFGRQSSGPWEHDQLRVTLMRLHQLNSLQVIPLLLPGGIRCERGRLPDSIREIPWIVFQHEISELEPLRRLISCMRGEPIEKHLDDTLCPYRGLLAFEEKHVDFFFGRAAAIQWLVEELQTSRFCAVIGPSGSGKSSIVRAGLVPAVKAGALGNTINYHCRLILPGARPLEELAHLLHNLTGKPRTILTVSDWIVALRADETQFHHAVRDFCDVQPQPTRLLLVIDQFEELFVLCSDPSDREAFLANLLFASSVERGYLTLVLTMRADFYHRCAGHSHLAARITEHQLLVGAMGREEIRQVIEQPAFMVGLQIEAGLVELLLNAMGNEPGMLTLLQHTLTELWERRVAGKLTVAAYTTIGGIAGSIALWAEQRYQELSKENQARAQQLFLSLVQPGTDAEDTKRRITLREIVRNEQEYSAWEELVNYLATQRLIVVNHPGFVNMTGSIQDIQIELVHEVLIQKWVRLRNWIDEARESLQTHRWLSQRAQEWTTDKEPSEALLGKSQLQRIRAWQATYHLPLGTLEQKYIRQSERCYRRTRLQRVVLGIGILLLALILSTYGGMAIWRYLSNWQPVLAANFQLVTTIASLSNERICVGTAEQGMHCRLTSQTQWQAKKLGVDDGEGKSLTGDTVHRLDHLTADPLNPDRYYVTVAKNGFYATTTAMDTWYRISAVISETNILDFTAYDNNIYALMREHTSDTQALYVSPNAGECWTQVAQSANGYSGERIIPFSPSIDDNELVHPCWQTTETWTPITLPTSLHTLAVAPTVKKLFIGTDNGIWQMNWQPPWEFTRTVGSPEAIVTNIEPIPNRQDSWYLASSTGNNSTILYRWQENNITPITTLSGKVETMTATLLPNARWQLFVLLTSGNVIAVAADGAQQQLGQPPDWRYVNSVVYDIQAFVDPLDSSRTWLLLGNWQGLYSFQGTLQ